METEDVEGDEKGRNGYGRIKMMPETELEFELESLNPVESEEGEECEGEFWKKFDI